MKRLSLFTGRLSVQKRLSGRLLEEVKQPSSEENESAPPLETLKHILSRLPKDRSLRSLQFLVVFTSAIKFFQTLIREQGHEAHMQCCQHMTYEFRTAQEVIFHKGDTGSKFYIILEGACSVLVPGEAEGQESMREIGVCRKGDSFGELALLKKQPRAATVQCTSESHFAVLSKADFDRIMGKVKAILLNRKVDFLLSVSLFASWTKGSMLKASYYFQERTYRRKQVVFSIGDEANEFFFVKDGEFQLVQSMESSSDKKGKAASLKEVAILGSKQIFGQEDVLESQNRTYTCVCHSTTGEVLVISREDFFKRFNNEDLQEKLREMHAQKLAFRSKRRETLSIVFTDQRLFQSPRESPLLRATASSLEAALALRKYALERRPARETPDLYRNARQVLNESPPPQPVSPSQSSGKRFKPATWDFILTRKQRSLQKSHTASTARVINIHTPKVRRKLMKAKTWRGLQESETPLPLCDGLFVKSLSER